MTPCITSKLLPPRMTAKRLLDDSNGDYDQPNEKRLKTRPAIFSVVGKALVQNSFQELCASLEPMLRRVVNEELDILLRRNSHSFGRSSSFRLQVLEPTSLKLVFGKKLSLPIFTGSKILDIDNAPLKISLVNKGSQEMFPTSLPCLIKVQVVVLDGDFPGNDTDSWTSEQFEKSVMKEREGKRPLLAGELSVTMRDGTATIGDLEFTDNSSWIRSRKFRLGVRVVPGSYLGVGICEGVTDAFVVKDHRGELYKKHHPPRLEDEVWRLEKIGKDGVFHKRLEAEGIKAVQDLLKLFVVDSKKLRSILGTGMSEKMWKVTIKHAKTCIMGNKLYISRGDNYVIFLNPVCQIVGATIGGQMYPAPEMKNINKVQIETFIRNAYNNWKSLDEVDRYLNEPALLTQGDEVAHYPAHPYSYVTDATIEVGHAPVNINKNVECSDMQLNPAYFTTSIQDFHFTISEQ